MRTIKKIHKAEYRPIDDLITYSPMPTAQLNHIDPFLFLNHHGPQTYKPNNNGLPFGPHPHRGMETVTFILEGDIAHKDSSGHSSVINEGGIQWMTAGSGLIHAEVSSDEFKEKGGPLEILQLWLNLPSKLKMTTPKYIGLQKDKIPEFSLQDKGAKVRLIAGEWNGHQGAFESMTNVTLSTIHLEAGAKFNKNVPVDENIFFYVVKGKVDVNGQKAEALQLVEFENDDEAITVKAESDSTLIFGHARPFHEKIVAYGPFVMNSEQEIQQAYHDYQSGKFGSWNH